MDEGNKFVTAREHYDRLAEEGHDPVYDGPILRQYMDRWDGPAFIDALGLTGQENVLEIGVGTGRLAVRVCPACGHFTGIDLSPRTIKAAQSNLSEFGNASLICGDFLDHPFREWYDVIYSSLTFMHIARKQAAIEKAASLLNDGGRFVLSICLEPKDILDFSIRKIRLYPDHPRDIEKWLTESDFKEIKSFLTDFAVVFTAMK